MKPILAVLPLLALTAAPAIAQEAAQEGAPRDLCSDRPGLNTSACTVDPGRLQAEIGLAGWTLDRQPDERSDEIDAGEILLRYGIGATTELRLGWTAFGHIRTRDRATGAIDRASGTGDVTIGLKQNLRHPAESAPELAVALLPSVTLPTGSNGVGAGAWSAGLIVPASYTLNDTLSFELSPEIDAAADQDGSGRHLAYGTAVGVSVNLTDTVTMTPEFQILADRDPADPVTMASAALSIAVQPAEMTQIDVQAVAGIDHDAPDIALSFGLTRKF
ncbi:transporter [Sphingomonas sanxanigenens]|uniref:Transporter n=1 Tax=Sphingomonas sanxanigenens DSM 19645 = NX02 TaxID=1123269 RepID=W0AFM5_9SPHN|nr:transporter [Sphingomonas sanxanigenens]AHE55068.1 hypothetical protein NX02_16950 [Sphingomonas sanxanigenens DSM 19645 = NX02]